MSGYDRVSRPPIVPGTGISVTANSNYAAESFYNIAAGDAAGDFPNLQPNVEFKPEAINVDMHKRYIWLAATALSEAGSAAWYFRGKLCAWLGASVIWQLPIFAAGFIPGTIKVGQFYVPPGQQPALRLRYAGDDTKTEDIPCFTLTLRANRISLVPEDLLLPFGGNAYAFGYQIISQYETV